MDESPINFIEDLPPIKPEKRSAKRSIFFALIIFIFIFLAGCVTYGYISTNISNSPDDYDPVTLEPKKPEGFFERLKQFVFKKDIKLAGEKDDRINILVLGMSGLGHDGPFLTDTIMIVSIKPTTNQISMISIPRDLGIYIKDYGWRKINHANAYGEIERSGWGAAYATEIIEDTFDIDIQYYMRFDFQAFKEIIDEVDGITVNVETSFTDHLYPTLDDDYQTIFFSAGNQTMSGDTALKYSRSRHGSNGEGSDFARARRQQKIILALKEKILSFGTLANPIRINNVIKTLDKHITTNMEFADIIAMLKLGRELDTGNIIKLVIDNSPEGYLKNSFTADGAFILEPTNGNFNQINHLIKNIFAETMSEFDDTPSQLTPTYTNANIEILNGTWRAGMAARIKNKLEERGFTISSIGNTEDRPHDLSGIFSVTTSPLTDVLQGLVQELHIPIKESPPQNISATSSADILIILGENFNE